MLSDQTRQPLLEISEESLTNFLVKRQEEQEQEKTQIIELFKIAVKLFGTKEGVALQ